MSKKRRPRKIIKLYGKVCPVCKKSFNTKFTYQQFCSVECRRSMEPFYLERKLLPKICVVCGIQYDTYRVVQKYCSNACRLAHFKEIYENDKELLRTAKAKNNEA